MSRIVLVNPGGLFGKELRERLGDWPTLPTDVTLVATREEEVGLLTEVSGAAAIVGRYEPEVLEPAQLVFYCGGAATDGPLLADLPRGCTAVLLAADAGADLARPAVAGVSEVMPGEGALLSPHPGAVGLAHLLHPLRPLGLRRAAATLILPASMHGEPALEELFAQTRSLITFSPQPKSPIFGGQLAFNVVPLPEVGERVVDLTARSLGGEPLPLAVQALEAGVFHAVSFSLWIELEPATTLRGVRQALAAHAPIEIVREGSRLGPVDGANSDGVQVGRIHPDPRQPGAFWLWAVMDNLTSGGVLNALGLATELLGGSVS